MNVKNMAGGIIAIVIVVVLFASAFLPIVGSATDSERTFTNEGVRMSPVGENDVTIAYDGNLHWTIAGTTYDPAERPITQGTIMFYEVTHATRTAYMYINSEGSYARYNVNNGDQDTIVYHGLTKTVDVTSTVASTGTTYSDTYNYVGEVYYYDPNGDYVWFAEKPTPAYIPSDWDRFNTWSIGSTHFYAIIGDTIMVDGVTSPEGVTYESTISDVEGITGVKTIDSYTLNIPEQDPIDCRGYILPYQVKGTMDVIEDNATLLSVIPILVTVGIILGIIGMLFLRRE